MVKFGVVTEVNVKITIVLDSGAKNVLKI